MKKAISLVTMMTFSMLVHATERGDVAPGFELPRLSGSGTVTLSDFAGKVVFIDFWASWCAPCRDSLPLLDRLHASLAARGFAVLAVNIDEDIDAGRRFLETYAVGYTVLSDQAGRVAASYDLVTMPTSFLVDRNGIVRYVHQGFRTADIDGIRRRVEHELEVN